MRVALYHNLPPGGALRAAWEFAHHASDQVAIDLFTLDFGSASPFSRDPAGGYPDFSPFVHRQHSEQVRPGIWGRLSRGTLDRIGLLREIRLAERRLAARINGGQYDVVLAHPCWFSQTPSLLLGLTVPTVFYMHEPRRASFEPEYAPRPVPRNPRRWPRWAVGGGIERSLRKRDLRAAQAPEVLACNSHFTAANILSAYSRKAEVAYLGVDQHVFTIDPGRPAASDVAGGGHVALCVGGLEPFKGQQRVVEAISRIPIDERPAVGLVYQRCDRAYRSSVLSGAQRLGVTIKEYSRISDFELAALYRQADFTILAADREPFGLVPIESMACGTPVLAIDEGGYRESVVHGKNGLLVRKSIDALADGAQRLARGELALTPQDIRRSVIDQWSWEAATTRQLTLLRTALAMGSHQDEV